MNIQKFVEAIKQYRSLDAQIKQLQEKQSKNREAIHEYVSKYGSQDYEGSKCFVQDRSKITYDIAKIKERLGKRSKEFIDDSVKFSTSWFISVCKDNGIDHKLFLKKGKYTREEAVNEKTLEQLIDQDWVRISELEGCYTVDKKESLVIRLSKDDL